MPHLGTLSTNIQIQNTIKWFIAKIQTTCNVLSGLVVDAVHSHSNGCGLYVYIPVQIDFFKIALLPNTHINVIIIQINT
jgi:hypothetical protein